MTMQVRDLIELLRLCDPHAEVCFHFPYADKSRLLRPIVRGQYFNQSEAMNILASSMEINHVRPHGSWATIELDTP